MPIACGDFENNGNYVFNEDRTIKTKDFIDNYCKLIGSFDTNGIELYLYKENRSFNFYGVLRNYDEKLLFLLECSPYEDLNLKKVLNVDLVWVREEFRQKGIATTIYKYLVNKNYILLGDAEQYFGARRLWSKLSRASSLRVDIVDLNYDKIILPNVELKRPTDFKDFDKRFYSLDDSKERIRPLLRK